MEKEKRTLLLAQHNLAISFAEIRQIRQAIAEGSLWELVEQRCRAHPNLLDALRKLGSYQEQLEKYDPPYKKSAFFYSGPESLNRPEVHRHWETMKRLPKKEAVLLLPRVTKPYSQNLTDYVGTCYGKGDYENIVTGQLKPTQLQLAVVDVPFGIIPLELDQVYPLAQNEAPTIMDEDARQKVKNMVEEYLEGFETALISARLVKKFQLELKDQITVIDPIPLDTDDLERVRMIADYQFQLGAGEALFGDDIRVVKSRKTGKIRHLYQGEELVATLRASDAVLVLAARGARKLHQHLPYPINRVVVNGEAEPFAREGKSIFAKFVINCDIDIHAQEEVLIVNSEDELLAFGKSILNGREITDFQTGQAVKTRKGGL
jgi:7-cyano-7-deazaguanine tRNA-ribosyltransferase